MTERTTKRPAAAAAKPEADNRYKATKVITNKVRFSYLHVFEPKAITEGGEEKYSASLIIPKRINGEPNPIIRDIKAAIAAATENGIQGVFKGKKPANLKTPLRDGDLEREGHPEYEHCYFINASSKTKPGLVDKYKEPIEVEDELYSGCYGRASINFFPFDAKGNKGIAAGLNNLQKLSDGEPLGGRASADSDFADEYEDDDEEIEEVEEEEEEEEEAPRRRPASRHSTSRRSSDY
jgi:hypothetical protein